MLSLVKRNLDILRARHEWAGNKDLLARFYQVISPAEINRLKKSHTIFIFGSGRSILELTPTEISLFRKSNTLSFNWFIKQSLLPMDFHLTRRIGDPDNSDGDNVMDKALEGVRRFFSEYGANPYYRDTVLLLQWELGSTGSQLAVANQLIPDAVRILPWHTKRGSRLSNKIDDGLTHGPSTLCESINWAYLFGWKSIVLVGVDLYDRDYFWMQRGQTTRFQRQGSNPSGMHSTAVSGVVKFIGYWNDELKKKGVQIYSYNPRSLLCDLLPTYGR